MGILDALPIWAIFLLTIVLIGVALEVGFKLGDRHHRRGGGRGDTAGAMVGATMGLLAFMLAFTFNWAAGRHDARKAMVTEEANAINVAWMRAAFLPEDDRRAAKALLREYVDVRLKAAVGDVPMEAAVPRTKALHKELWTIAERAPRTDGMAMTSALFAQAVNEVISVHLKRLAVGVRQRVAGTIWIVLYTLGVLGMLMTGGLAGISQVRHKVFEVSFAIAFSLVLCLIADLDRPQQGLVNVSQQAMVELRDAMDAK
jgi:hypothetical protein